MHAQRVRVTESSPTQVFGLYAYLLAFYMNPPSAWWGSQVPENRMANEVKRTRGIGKAFLKDLLRRYLPGNLLYRPKQGFPVPIAKWFREDLHEPVRAILLDERSVSRGNYRREYVAECLKRHRTGREDFSRRLFALLVLELWHRKYDDGESGVVI